MKKITKNKKGVGAGIGSRKITTLMRKKALIRAYRKQKGNVTRTSKEAGCAMDRFYAYLKQDPEFKKAIQREDLSMIEDAETEVYVRGMNKENDGMLKYYLSHKKPSVWGDKVSISADVNQKVVAKMDVKLDLSNLTEEELELAEKLSSKVLLGKEKAVKK